MFSNNLDYVATALDWDLDWEVSTQRVQLQSVTGQHEINVKTGREKTNDDVEELNIKHQRALKYLPLLIGKIFRNLKNLSANFNGLKLVRREVFLNMEKVALLWLQDNEIKELTEKAFTPLVHLEYLRLSRNKIRNIDESSFEGLHKLKKLRLDSNLINVLPENVFID